MLPAAQKAGDGDSASPCGTAAVSLVHDVDHSSEIVLAAPRQMRTVLADGGWLGHSGVVRTRVTKKAWFGPKRLIGWGWSIARWEGRLVTAVVLGLALAAHFVWHSIVAVVALLILYGVVILLTGDPPGRPGRGD